MRRLRLLALLLCAGCGVGRVFGTLHGQGTRGPNGELISDGSSSLDKDSDGDGIPDVNDGDSTNVVVARIQPDAPGCGRGEVAPATRTPVHFMFTIDRSGSMNDNDAAMAEMRDTKWVNLQRAIVAVLNDMVSTANGTIAVGINYFSGSSDSSVDFPMQLLDRAAADVLIDDINNRTASSSTPTEEALTRSYNAIASYAPGGSLANGSKAVVLVSDGKPNPAPASPDDIPDLVASKAGVGIRTYSIGIGERADSGQYGYDPQFMSNVAFKGGTAKSGCDPSVADDETKFCHHQITPSQSDDITADLVAAFNAIRDSLRSCTLPLNIENAASLEPRAVIVVADKAGEPQRILAKGTDWTFDNDTAPTKVQLHGGQCDALKQDPQLNVFAILGCACAAGGSGNMNGPQGGARGNEGNQDPWNTDWCSYPWAVGCVGEGC